VSCDNRRVRAQADHRGTELTRLRRYTWWSLPGTAAVVMVVLVGGWLLRPEVPSWARGCAAVALAVAVVVAVVLLTRRLARLPDRIVDARPGRWLVAGNAAASVLGVLLLEFREYGRWAVVPAILVAITAAYLPSRPRWVLVTIAAASAAIPGAAVSLVSGDDVLYAAAFPPGLVVFTAWVILGPLWAWDIAERLDRAREMSAQLAVKDERLRFAADLHDIQGHHLQVIARTSELAARLAEVDPARAATVMAEVQQVATDALQETRALVQGYRRTTLEAEISNAVRVLAAADIDARMNVEPGDTTLAEPARHLLGLVVREATTNVLRHSHATRADVEYRVDDGCAHLVVTNDGAVHVPGAAGSGLTTLSQRLAAANGELTWRHDGDRFVVAATLPVCPAREAT